MSSNEINCSLAEMMRTAAVYAKGNMGRGVEAIDECFGEGFAKDNPALLAAFMQTAAIAYHGAMTLVAGQHVRDSLRYAAERVSEKLDEIEGALGGIDEGFTAVLVQCASRVKS